MEEKGIIKLSKKTMYSTRPSYGSKFIVIGDNNEALRYFICHSLVNIFFEESFMEIADNYTNYVLNDILETWQTGIYYHKMQNCKKEVATFFQEILSKGFYIKCHSDDYYIKGSSHYGTDHFISEHLIYGLDTNKNEFFITSFGDTGLRDYVIPVDIYLSSLCSFCDDIIPFTFSKIKSNNDYAINKDVIYQNICDYVNSKNRFEFFGSSKKTFGVQAISDYYSYVNNLMIQKMPIQINDCLLLLDHKKLFAERLEYLEKSGVITQEKWSAQYSQIIKMARVQLEYCQSYNERLAKKQSISCSIPLSNEMISAEKNILNRLIKSGI